ncbi:MAG: hypothetical protein LM514_04535 [Streptococcus sp.]|nr:hypothetical protein [Streptococcus sp.]
MISKLTRQLDIRCNPFFIIVASTLFWAIPLYFDKFSWIADLAVHYQWVTQFHIALSEGVWVPRWASLSHLSLGDPTFLYIHPAYYYVVALVNFLIGDI